MGGGEDFSRGMKNAHSRPSVPIDFASTSTLIIEWFQVKLFKQSEKVEIRKFSMILDLHYSICFKIFSINFACLIILGFQEKSNQKVFSQIHTNRCMFVLQNVYQIEGFGGFRRTEFKNFLGSAQTLLGGLQRLPDPQLYISRLRRSPTPDSVGRLLAALVLTFPRFFIIPLSCLLKKCEMPNFISSFEIFELIVAISVSQDWNRFNI